MRIVVLTGGSSGIGKAAAELFSKRGDCVYELSRSGCDTEYVHHLTCDVTDESAVSSAIGEVVEKEGRIDILVSNAGFGISGPIEFTDMAEAKRQFNVNFFGTVNLVQQVLPLMRKQRSGMIILTSSIAAILSIPFQAFYSASKASLNAFVLALRNEVCEFGIVVTALMPGDVKSGFTAARRKDEHGAEVYTHLNKAIGVMEKDEQGGMSCEAIAERIVQISLKHNPAPLYTAGWEYHLFVFLESILPKRLSNWIVGKIYS